MEGGSCSVMDPIHNDSIYFPKPLRMVIDTPEFQRLRKISQLGLANRVYPTAGHSRFEHCLGVSHLAGLFVDQLARSHPHLITSVDALAIRLAGLLHDLGHGPYSHAFERVLARFVPGYSHEQSSLAIFDHLFRCNPDVKAQLVNHHGFTDQDFVFVKELIHPPPDAKKMGGREKKLFLYEIISNAESGFDVDKYDYFLRDAYHTGVGIPFKTPDITRLISTARLLPRPSDGRLTISYPRKIARTLRAVGVARMILHESVYQHKTTVAFEHLLPDALGKAEEAGLRYPGRRGETRWSLREAVEGKPGDAEEAKCEGLLALTDGILDFISQQSGDGLDENKLSSLREAQELIEQVESRRQPRLVCELTLESATNHDAILTSARSKAAQNAELQNLPLDSLIFKVAEFHAGKKEVDPLTKVHFYDSDGCLLHGDELGLDRRIVCARRLFVYCPCDVGLNGDEKRELTRLFRAVTSYPFPKSNLGPFPTPPHDDIQLLSSIPPAIMHAKRELHFP